MKYSKADIFELSELIRPRLSEKRFKHTLFVLEAAKRIGQYFNEIDISELSCAALLHDVTKELSYEEQISLITEGNIELTDEDRETPAILHSLSAPIVIERDFPEFATKNILSAVEKHTTGSDEMSLFDKIVFIADYVEDTRIYDSCIEVRERLFSSLSRDQDYPKNEAAVNKAVLDSLIFTEKDIIKRGRTPNARSLKAKEALLSFIDIY